MENPKFRRALRGGVAGLVWFMATGFCLVMFSQSQQSATQPEVKSEDVSDAELTSLAVSLEQIEVIRLNLENKLARVQEASEAQKLQQQANVEMTKVLANNGMNPSRYNTLIQVINGDENFFQRFQAIRKERTEEQNK